MLQPRLSIAVCVAMLMLTRSHAVLAESQQRYNVLYFIVDDLRPEFLEAYGQSQMLTPNVVGQRPAAWSMVDQDPAVTSGPRTPEHADRQQMHSTPPWDAPYNCGYSPLT